MPFKDLTNNQYYSGLNNRFDKRMVLVRKMGLTFNPATRSFYSCYDCRSNQQKIGLSLSIIMHCNNRHFLHELIRLCWKRNALTLEK